VSYIVRHEQQTARVVYRKDGRERVVAMFYAPLEPGTTSVPHRPQPVDGVEKCSSDAEALAAKLNERLAAALQQEQSMRDAAVRAQRITERGRVRR
jgi:hypothetical protein